MFRVLVVDDTLFFRTLIKSLIREIPEFEFVGSAASGDRALQILRSESVDLVLLDIHMPGLSMLETLEAIVKNHPETQIVLMSGISNKSTPITLEGLTRGALDFIQKPQEEDFSKNSEELKQNLLRLVGILELKGKRSPKGYKSASLNSPILKFSAKLIVIGVSTGGPTALKEIFSRVKTRLPVPVLVVQHMPEHFTSSLAQNLNQNSVLEIVEAAPLQMALPGYVYLAPGGKHLMVKKRAQGIELQIDDGPRVQSCKPSVDVLFNSIAREKIPGVACLVLTGMGMDGLAGVRALKEVGALCLTQTKDSCVVYGMPRAIDEAGLSDGSYPLAQLSGALERISGVYSQV